jgi:cell division GTPase FtsZ
MSDSFELIDTYQNEAVIKIISVSESGDEAVRNMESHLDGINVIYSNSVENLRDVLKNTDMVFLIGIADNIKTREIIEISLESNTLIIAIVTTSIQFEIGKIIQLRCNVEDGQTINDVLLESVRGITDSLIVPGIINVDFDDIKIVMSCGKSALIAIGSAVGENRARKAVQQAISSQLFRGINLKTAQGIFVCISASEMGLSEFNDVGDIVCEFASKDATIKIGISIEPELGDAIKVTIIVADFDNTDANLLSQCNTVSISSIQTSPVFRREYEAGL